MANIKDFAVGLVVTPPSPATTGTTAVLRSGDTVTFPAPPFYATAQPPGQLTAIGTAEKILVTAVDTSTETITFTRAQNPTSAKGIAAGWIIANAMYVDDVFTSSLSLNQNFVGTVNGTNAVFTLGVPASSIIVYKNGVRQKPGVGNDYVFTNNTTVTFEPLNIPLTGAVLTYDAIIGGSVMVNGSNSLISDETPAGAVNGTNAVFITSRPYVGGSLEVFINGVKQKRVTHFTETSPTASTFTMSDAPVTGDDIMVVYHYTTGVSGNADTVDGYNANVTPAPNQIPVLDGGGKLPASVAWATPTLSTGWGAWDAGAVPAASTGIYRFPRYFQDVTGMVHLTGLAKNTSAAANNSTTNQLIFTLPAGLRPGHTQRITVVGSITGGDGFQEIDIETNGQVRLIGVASIPASQWISLNNIHFLAEQ